MEDQDFQVDNSTNRHPIFLPDSSRSPPIWRAMLRTFLGESKLLSGAFSTQQEGHHTKHLAAQQPDDVTIASMLTSIKSKIEDLHLLAILFRLSFSAQLHSL